MWWKLPYYQKFGIVEPQEADSNIRQNKIPLQQLSVNLAIANRTYQQEAIERVSERFDEGHLRALMVMATGTGKTRTIMALIELFLRANQARTVLFVADRDALVKQALDENFKVYLPNEPRDRIRTYKVDYSKRLYVGTLQTLIKCYKKFTPGFALAKLIREVLKCVT